MAASSSSFSLSFNIRSSQLPKFKTLNFHSNCLNSQLNLSFPLHSQQQKQKQKLSKNRTSRIYTSISTQEQLRTSADDLVSSILSKVVGTDRGVALPTEGHEAVAKEASELQNYCVDKPVQCPLIFGDWDVVYCSVPTSPGGGYRSALGRIVFKTKEMIQVVEAPDVVKNKVSFSAFGFLDGEVSLKGKLKALDDKWIQVIFEPPQLTVGAFDFQYGGESEVKLEITYVDEKIRLGKGSRGSLFVFKRC